MHLQVFRKTSNTYKVCTLINYGHEIFIEHVWICHSILSHFLDRGFCGWRAENWASIVLRSTKSTHNSTIYKLKSGPAGWLAQYCTSVVPYPPNSTRSSAIYKLTDGLEDWRVQVCHCLWMVIPTNYLTYLKTLFSILNY
jgi:hypothetical protein